MKKKINKIIICLLIITNTVIIFSCAEEGDNTVNAEAAGNKVDREQNLPADDNTGDVPTAEESLLSVISEPEGRDFLLYSEESEELVYPEDFEIGLLQGIVDADKRISEIMNTAEGFLSTLLIEEPDYSFVADERKDFVQRNINFELMQAVPDGYKIGFINTEAEPVRAAVRLSGEGGSAEGTMYFINENGWKIFDLHIDISDLNKDEEPTEESWYPSERLM